MPQLRGTRDSRVRGFRRAGVLAVLVLIATACDPPGFINTIAGNGTAGWSGDGGAATAAAVGPVRVAWAPDGRWAFTDASNHVRLVGTDKKISTIAGLGGFAPENGPLGDGGPADVATLDAPTGLAYDAAGDLFVADTGDNVVREINHTTGVISTVAGGGISTADGVAATSALLTAPTDLSIDAANDLFIVESSSGLVRKVDGTTHLISTVAGGGADTSDGVAATTALLTSPGQVAVVGTRLYVAESGAVRVVDLTTGLITTLAGTGTAGDTGDGGFAFQAQVDATSGLAVDAANDVYFSQGDAVRKVDQSTALISTVAGTGTSGFAGDHGVSNVAQLSGPLGLAVNPGGTLLVADSGNNRVRSVVDVANAPTTPGPPDAIPLGGGRSYFGGDAAKYGLPTTTATSGGPQDYTYPPVSTSTTTYTDTLKANASGNKACAVDPAYVAIVGWKYFGKTGIGTNTAPTGAGVPTPLPTCTWTVTWVTHTTSPGPQPITYPSPGFWANVAGPESDATNGDVFSTRCYGGNNCVAGAPGHVTNNSYRSGGYTYAITVPTTNVPSSLAVQVFDAGLYPRSSQTVETGDSVDATSAGASNFTTQYQLYDADATPTVADDNPPMTAAQCGGSAGNQTPGAGHWALASGDAAATFENNWVTLCTISNPVPGAVYLLRVKSDHSVDGTTEASGMNRYALQVVSADGSDASVAPLGDAAVYNNVNTGTLTLDLADLGPDDAGRTLDVDVWDPGDAGSGTTEHLTVQPPSGTASCSWASTYGKGYASAPTGGNGFGGTPSKPAHSTGNLSPCVVETATSGASHFNGLWVHIRVPIPADYTCDPATPPTCQWSLRYDASSTGGTDNTTWSAHLS